MCGLSNVTVWMCLQEEAGGFRTRAAREAEEAAKAAAYSRVAIRLHLPGGAILQVGAAQGAEGSVA